MNTTPLFICFIFLVSSSATNLSIQQRQQQNLTESTTDNNSSSISPLNQLQFGVSKTFRVPDVPAGKRYRISFLLPSSTTNSSQTNSLQLVTLYLDVIPPDKSNRPPHSAAGALPILSVALNDSTPSSPDFTSEDCSKNSPCVAEDMRSDTLSLQTRSPYAFLSLQASFNEKITVAVDSYVWRGNSKSSLKGYRLVARVVEDVVDNLACPGSAMGKICSDEGKCGRSKKTGRTLCSCNSGFGGRSCDVKISSPPKMQKNPSWDGSVEPLKESAIERIRFPGMTWAWKVVGEKGRIEVRARLLYGRTRRQKDGKVIGVGGASSKGAVAQMIIKERWANKGTGLEKGTDVPTVYDKEAYARVLLQKRGEDDDMYDLVFDTEKKLSKNKELIVSILLIGTDTQDEQVVSIQMRRCGEEGTADCAYNPKDEGFPMAVAIALGAVAAVVLVVLVMLCICRCGVKNKWGSEYLSDKGTSAWESVNMRSTDGREPLRGAVEKVNTLDEEEQKERRRRRRLNDQDVP